MKILLFVCLLFCSLGSKEQTDSTDSIDSIDSIDFTHALTSTGTIIGDSGIIGNMGSIYLLRNPIERRKDTVTVLMLVCDTSRLLSVLMKIEYDSAKTAKLKSNYAMCCAVNDTNYYEPNHTVTWIKGYEAREQVMTCCGGAWGESYYWMTESYVYLDADKKPLSKNIIVWLSKEVQ